MHLTLHRPLLKIFRVNAFLQKWAAQVAPYYYIVAAEYVASCVPHKYFSEFRAFFVHINLPLFFNSSKSLIKTIPLHTRSIDCNEPLVFISLMIRSTFDSEFLLLFLCEQPMTLTFMLVFMPTFQNSITNIAIANQQPVFCAANQQLVFCGAFLHCFCCLNGLHL